MGQDDDVPLSQRIQPDVAHEFGDAPAFHPYEYQPRELDVRILLSDQVISAIENLVIFSTFDRRNEEKEALIENVSDFL